MSNVITGIDLYIDAINRCDCQGGGEHPPSNHLTFDAIDQSNPQDNVYRNIRLVCRLSDTIGRVVIFTQNSGKTGGSRINHLDSDMLDWFIRVAWRRMTQANDINEIVFSILGNFDVQDLFLFLQGVWIIQSCLVYTIKINFFFPHSPSYWPDTRVDQTRKMEIFEFFYYCNILQLHGNLMVARFMLSAVYHYRIIQMTLSLNTKKI